MYCTFNPWLIDGLIDKLLYENACHMSVPVPLSLPVVSSHAFVPVHSKYFFNLLRPVKLRFTSMVVKNTAPVNVWRIHLRHETDRI
jgi:hypothetical protein